MALVLAATLAVPEAASADGTGRGRLFVPGDHFDPGATLSISGTELDPGAELVLRLVSGSTTVEVGRATVGDDRTMAATAAVPAGFPAGYAELTATDAAGTSWSTFILIGDRAEGPGATPSGGITPDQQTIAFLVLGLGLVVFVMAGVLYVRGRSTKRSRHD